MKFLPDLHRVEAVAQWQTIPSEEWNPDQVRAAETHGIDTPGNRITVEGFTAGLAGLQLLDQNNVLGQVVGLGLIAYGRNCDLKDGKAAAASGTMSPLGEALDATVDTVLMARALPVLKRQDILTPQEAANMHQIVAVKSLASGVAKARKVGMHASRTGKYGTYLQWAGIVTKTSAYVAGRLNARGIESKLNTAGDPLMNAGIQLGRLSTLGYMYGALKPRHRR